MSGYLSFLLHAHLPFVRHPEHERFLEESWLHEAVLETYLPLLRMLQGWQHDGLSVTLTLTLSPTLCSMLCDSLLQQRCTRRMEGLLQLAELEIQRTTLEPERQSVARYYRDRFAGLLDLWRSVNHDLVSAFGRLQQQQRIEIITCAATHALLPMFAAHTPSLRAQILTARDHYRECFGSNPRGIWLPECAYVDAIEPVLKEAGVRWFALESHGVLHAAPEPRFGVYAPLLTPNGLAVFGRDLESAREVWSRKEGYPGDPCYRDFYRDIGYDLDFDYVRPFLPSPDHRGFTGLKLHRITGHTQTKQLYDRQAALEAVERHAQHFVQERVRQLRQVGEAIHRPPFLLMPYDAELFGHWWHEGMEFLDAVVRKVAALNREVGMMTPSDYLRVHPTQQVASPAASSWGEHGYYEVWINETNDWVLPHLHSAQERMSALVQQWAHPNPLQRRALRQAARELMLAQASDWPFLLRTGTSADYARQRVIDHVLRFNDLHDQLVKGAVDKARLQTWEEQDNLFPDIDYQLFLRPRDKRPT